MPEEIWRCFTLLIIEVLFIVFKICLEISIALSSLCENRSRILQCIEFLSNDLLNNYMNFNT